MQLIPGGDLKKKKPNELFLQMEFNLVFCLLVFSFIVFQIIIVTTLDGALFFMIYNFYENILWSLLTTVLDGIFI